jgi:hypothetical protein
MKELKRDCVKYVRDRAKSRYTKGSDCFICGETDNLDFHHFYSLTPLLNRWMLKNRLDPKDVLEFRDEFIEEHYSELYEHTVTLCRFHHQKLHSIYGKYPSLGTAKKQMRWVNIQRDKHGELSN